MVDRKWAMKKIEKVQVGAEVFLPRKFSSRFLLNLQYLPNKYNWQIYFLSKFVPLKLSGDLDWAAILFVCPQSGL